MIGYKPSYQYSGLYDNLKRDPYRSATIGKVFKDTLDTLKRQIRFRSLRGSAPLEELSFPPDAKVHVGYGFA
jgi:hypothetical protein